jgi:hypothetical protein
MLMVDATVHPKNQQEAAPTPAAIAIDASKIPNAVLQRLIEEVRHDHQNHVAEYNRTHNRHNRGR